MEPAVQQLLRDFVHETRVSSANREMDVDLQRLVDDDQSDSAVCKRDMRRLLEKAPAAFLQSACWILKASEQRPGTEPLLELLWSSSLPLASLIDPALLSLPAAVSLAKRWVVFDPMLDIKLLQMGFPLGEDDSVAAADMRRPKRALDVVSELPPNRHSLLSLAKLLRYPDAHVRSKAALLYGRAGKNPEWVWKMLAEPDARVRSNAVEGLWHTKSAAAAALFREAALDTDHRVAANALIGLHYCGEPDGIVADILQNMVRSDAPAARAAAAFAIGKIQDGASTSVLENLLRDGDPGVRGEALRSLIQIRRRAVGTPEEQATPAGIRTDEKTAPEQAPAAS